MVEGSEGVTEYASRDVEPCSRSVAVDVVAITDSEEVVARSWMETVLTPCGNKVCLTFSTRPSRPHPKLDMHCRFLIPEIVRLICAELGSTGAKKTLAGLARTCLWFNEPALDSLWYELHDLTPLIKCMPPDLWQESEGKLVRMILYLWSPCA